MPGPQRNKIIKQGKTVHRKVKIKERHVQKQSERWTDRKIKKFCNLTQHQFFGKRRLLLAKKSDDKSLNE